MLTTLILAAVLQARSAMIARAIVWGMMHDHPSIAFDHCLRVKHRSQCNRERDEANRDACRFILRDDCTL
jgi:hypothetical protein